MMRKYRNRDIESRTLSVRQDVFSRARAPPSSVKSYSEEFRGCGLSLHLPFWEHAGAGNVRRAAWFCLRKNCCATLLEQNETRYRPRTAKSPFLAQHGSPLFVSDSNLCNKNLSIPGLCAFKRENRGVPSSLSVVRQNRSFHLLEALLSLMLLPLTDIKRQRLLQGTSPTTPNIRFLRLASSDS
jgi:hypothetical protein